MSHIQQLNYILFIPILVVGYVQAQPISKQEAAEMAIQYVLGISDLQQRKQALVDQDIDTTNIRTFATCGKARFYIVNMPDSGWVIISGDERILPILATSPSGTFPLDNDIPPAMLGLLNDYADEIAFVQDSCPEATINSGWLAFREGVYTISSSYNGKNSSVYHSSNLLSTSRGEVQWNQNGCVIDNGSNDYCNYVYNKFCPVCTIGSCGKSYVGCVAVAIAQIMWYWQWPYYAYIPSEISVNGTPSSVLELHLYDWKQMPPYLTTSTPLLQVDAVAGFLRDCGYAAHMKYCIEDGSSSSISYAKNALEDYFGYEISAVRSKSTTTNWIGKIKDEIDNGRPLYYRGSGTGGHAFVVDGYNESNLFHINWGWGGLYNAYFSLDNLVPIDGHNYNSMQKAIFGIHPKPLCGGINVATMTTTIGGNYYSINTTGGPIILHNVSLQSGNYLYCYSGTQIQLTSGFHAYRGSEIQLDIRNFLCDDATGVYGISPDEYSVQNIYSKSLQLKEKEETIVVVYPNPANSDVVVECAETIKALKLYSISGHELLMTQNVDLHIADLPSGIYILKIFTEHNVFQKKIIKQ